MSLIRAKAGKRKFVLGRASTDTQFAELKRRYRKSIEAGLIVSLILAILATRIATSVDTEKYFQIEDHVVLEFIDIPEIPPVIEEPPKMQMEEVVELPATEEEVVEEKAVAEEEIEELLGDNEEQVELALNTDDVGSYLVSDSPIGAVTGTELSIRDRTNRQDGDLALKRGNYTGAESSSAIDIGQEDRKSRRLISDESSVNFAMDYPQKPLTKPQPPKREATLRINGKQERILSFSSSTIGTEDYKLWNKIISELDRLNKGRYANASDRLRRDRGGFVIDFDYADGVAHEVNWRNSGNVWIKVIGASTKSNLEELRRVLSSLLQMTLN